MNVDMKDYMAYQQGYEAGKRDAAAAIEALQAEVERLQADVDAAYAH